VLIGTKLLFRIGRCEAQEIFESATKIRLLRLEPQPPDGRRKTVGLPRLSRPFTRS